MSALIHFDTIDSTNDYLKNKHRFLDDWTIITTDYQDKGHGRFSRAWESERGKNLLCSILVRDEELFKYNEQLSLITAVAVFKLLTKLKINNIKIKWPNDIYVNDKKICGILLDSTSVGDEIRAIIIGIGLNLNQEEFNNADATSYKIETKQGIKIDKVVNQLSRILRKETKLLKRNKSNYIKIINDNNYLLNKDVYAHIRGEKVLVKALDINRDGSLNVLFNNQKEKIISDEVSFKQ